MTYRQSKAFFSIFVFAALMVVSLFGLMHTAVSPAVAAPTADTCFIETTGDNITDYQSADASAVQTAVAAANPGDLLKIAGTCTGAQQISGITQTAYIAKNLTLQGGYTTTNWAATPDPVANPTTLSANSLGRVVVITDTATATIENLIVMSGTANAGGGLYVDTAAGLTLLNSQVMSNTAIVIDNSVHGGGGLGNLGQTVISGTTFSNNGSERAGAVGNGSTGRLTINGSTFSHNLAGSGGALGNTGWVTVTASSFISNTSGSGGAMANASFSGSPGWMWLENSTFISNTVPGSGSSGGAIDNDGGELHVLTSTFRANSAGGGGGAIYNNSSSSGVAPTLYISHTNFISNTAGSRGGGVIRHRTGTVSIMGSTFRDNSTSAVGGAIRVRSGTVGTFIANSTFSANQADASGGGTDGGGGIYSEGNLTITNSTFSANETGGGGGGVANIFGSAQLIHTTFFTNTADVGGAFANLNGTVTLTGTIVAGTATETCFNSGGTVTATHSLFEVATCGFSDGVNGNIVGSDPLLDVLADNGGETETHAPLEGSPALDVIPGGSCTVSTDQRGISRPQGDNCDIGAVEIESNPVCFVSLNNSGTTDYESADASAVQQAINNASDGDTLRIAGTCAGVVETAGISQTAYISQNLTLQGGYTTTNWLASPDPATYPTVLDAQNSGRVVYNHFGDTAVTLAGLTIQNGASTSSGGGVAHFGAGMVISQSQIISNTANDGGGIYNGTVLTVTHSTVSGNSVTTVGGGIGQDGGTLTVMDSLISGNSAILGGGGVQDDDSAGAMTFINSTVQNNHSDDKGGGVADEGGPLTLTNSTVQGNQAQDFGGGLYKRSGPLTVTGTHILSNTASTLGGGGIAYDGGDAFNISDSLISGNMARFGGGIDSYQGAVNIVRTTLQHNRAITVGGGAINTSGGAISLLDSTVQYNHAATNGGGIIASPTILDEGTVISNTTFYSNTALGDGGGFYVNQPVVITNSTINENDSGDQGGAGYLASSAELSLYASDAMSNTAVNEGGGLYVAGAIFTATQSSILSNTGSVGGGIYMMNNSSATLRDSTINGNTGLANNDGGGIHNSNGTLSLMSVTMAHNRSGRQGGAVYSTGSGENFIINSNLYSNTARTFGGAIMNSGQLVISNTRLADNWVEEQDGGAMHLGGSSNDVTIVNSTISGNSAQDVGGVSHVGGQVRLVNSTISQNIDRSGSTGGVKAWAGAVTTTLTNTTIVSNTGFGLDRSAGDIVFYNSLIAYNGSSDCNYNDINNMISGGYNLASDSSCAFLTATGDITNTDPLLGPLADNGGSSTSSGQATFTHGLLPGSPALDVIPSGSCALSTDQRGVERPQGAACDMGAFEGQGYTLSYVGGTGQQNGVNMPLDEALQVSLTFSGTTSGVPGQVITFTAPDSGASLSETPITATTSITGLASLTPTVNGTTGSYVVTASSPVAGELITFTLENLPVYTLTTATAGDGSGGVTSGGIYVTGTVVTITATENTGSYFTGWVGSATGATNPLTVTMDSDKSITATFDLYTYTLSVATDGPGSGAVTAVPDQASYDYGTVVTVTAVAVTGSTFTGWSGDCSGTAVTCVLTMDEAKDVTATFTKYTIYLPVVIKP